MKHDYQLFTTALWEHEVPVELLSTPAELDAAIAEARGGRDPFEMQLLKLVVQARAQRREGRPRDSILAEFRAGVEAVWARGRGQFGVNRLVLLGVVNEYAVCCDVEDVEFGNELKPVELDWSQMKEKPVLEGTWSRESLRDASYSVPGTNDTLPPLAATLAGGAWWRGSGGAVSATTAPGVAGRRRDGGREAALVGAGSVQH